MKCLCCGKTLPETASVDELRHRWHSGCVKKFFATSSMPSIDISEEELKRLAQESVNKGLTVPGVQKKLSLHLSHDGPARLTLMNYPTGFILKPETEEYPALPEAEDLAMRLAEYAGIRTVPHALMLMYDKQDRYAYITKRIDRQFSGKRRRVQMLAMEDFCQLDGRLTQDKYRGSYERCAKVIKAHSVRSGLDLSELFLRLVFSFIIGNSDMHLKNFSLIETSPCSGEYVLSAAYDLLPVNVILPEDADQFALTMNGKKRHIRRNDFLIFAAQCNISERSAVKMLDKLISLTPQFQKCAMSPTCRLP